jgi:large subunit ribosomal protein L35Ae
MEMTEVIEGSIINYRTGPRTQRPKEYIIRFQSIKSPGEAGRLIGRKVAWPTKERKIRGKIIGLHGKNGLLMARFRKGLPGESVGTHIEIIG